MKVDQLILPEERAKFAARQDAVVRTAEHYGLNADNIALIGGGAFALHGIDTHVPEATEENHKFSKEKFDLEGIDVVSDPARRGVMRAVLGLSATDRTDTYNDPAAPLALTRLRGPTAVNVARNFFRYPSYDSMARSRVKVRGLATLPVDRLVLGKLLGMQDGRAKDEAGIIKAHVVGVATGHEVVSGEYWRESVAFVMSRVMERPAPAKGRRPEWLIELSYNGFNHPAFEDIKKLKK